MGEIRDGHIPEGGGASICAEHRAACLERTRKPAAPRIVTFPPTAEDLMIEHSARLALAAASAGQSAPPGAILH
jgi:hypothetical protein